MRCKHAIRENLQLQSLRQPFTTLSVTNCGLKMQSLQREIYGKLFQLGFEGTMISDICPLAQKGNWSDCPYYKAA